MREPRWHRLAIRDLEKLRWRTAANIDAAIREFASTGACVLRKIDVDGTPASTLRRAVLRLDFSNSDPRCSCGVRYSKSKKTPASS